MSDDKLVITIRDKDYTLDYQNDVKCAKATIDKNLIEQSSLYAWYAVLQAEADREYQDAKTALEVLEAGLGNQIREDMAEAGLKTTETQIKSGICLKDDWQEARDWMNRARYNAKVLAGFVRALDHRKDMLVTLASNMRSELVGDVGIRKDQYESDIKSKSEEK